MSTVLERSASRCETKVWTLSVFVAYRILETKPSVFCFSSKSCEPRACAPPSPFCTKPWKHKPVFFLVYSIVADENLRFFFCQVFEDKKKSVVWFVYLEHFFLSTKSSRRLFFSAKSSSRKSSFFCYVPSIRGQNQCAFFQSTKPSTPKPLFWFFSANSLRVGFCLPDVRDGFLCFHQFFVAAFLVYKSWNQNPAFFSCVPNSSGRKTRRDQKVRFFFLSHQVVGTKMRYFLVLPSLRHENVRFFNSFRDKPAFCYKSLCFFVCQAF